mmetsp:Transcript_119582/g.371733  ORF Transcript_119582/g.371733 Transcript_119582/m.371733 type:complete len:294 (+) Transcript_119582:981-1862(+)
MPRFQGTGCAQCCAPAGDLCVCGHRGSHRDHGDAHVHRQGSSCSLWGPAERGRGQHRPAGEDRSTRRSASGLRRHGAAQGRRPRAVGGLLGALLPGLQERRGAGAGRRLRRHPGGAAGHARPPRRAPGAGGRLLGARRPRARQRAEPDPGREHPGGLRSHAGAWPGSGADGGPGRPAQAHRPRRLLPDEARPAPGLPRCAGQAAREALHREEAPHVVGAWAPHDPGVDGRRDFQPWWPLPPRCVLPLRQTPLKSPEPSDPGVVAPEVTRAVYKPARDGQGWPGVGTDPRCKAH